MSLVGPRPIVSHEKAKYRDSYFFYASAKPGLSGLWQVSGRSDLSYDRRVALDEEYVRRWNIAFDLAILWRTAGAVWRSEAQFRTTVRPHPRARVGAAFNRMTLSILRGSS